VKSVKSWQTLIFLPTLILIAVGAHAQIGAYANFAAATQYRTTTFSTPVAGGSPTITSNTNQYWTYGPTFGLYAQAPLPLIAIGGDARYSFYNGNQLRHWSGVIGPRLVVKPPVLGIKPYGEFLVGVGGYRDSAISNTTTTHIDYTVAAGVDSKILPFLDWRIVEFTYNSYYNNSGTASKGISTGLVFRIP
jgi:hypothetical protein